MKPQERVKGTPKILTKEDLRAMAITVKYLDGYVVVRLPIGEGGSVIVIDTDDMDCPGVVESLEEFMAGMPYHIRAETLGVLDEVGVAEWRAYKEYKEHKEQEHKQREAGQREERQERQAGQQNKP